MPTIEEIVAREKALKSKPDEEELRRLPDRVAEIHGRLSGWDQVKSSAESIREIADLVALAKQEGYKSRLEPAGVERWLADIQAGVARPGVLEDGELIVNCLGLGVSGSLPEEKRPDLVSTMDRLRKGALGTIYVTEGANRLSRDRDRVVSATLLKLMKETNCKLRTPEEVLSPRIKRDWEAIRDQFEEGAEELALMQVRLQRRKVRKAKRGEFVGEPIPPGFILPIVGRRPNGSYLFGKMEPYPPHAQVCARILEEYESQGRSPLRTVRVLGGLTFPSFPPELSYMERLSSLRACRKTEAGYHVTPDLVQGIATNPKQVGIWKWGDNIIPGNHPPGVPEDLFLRNYEPSPASAKPRGRAVNYEPLEWDGLLWDYNHQEPYPVASYASVEEYRCQRDYRSGAAESICFTISARFIDKPLTTEVLRQLDFTPYTDEVRASLEAEAARGKLGESQRKREKAALEQEVAKWKMLLPGCADLETGKVDRQREEYYWARIGEAEARLEALKATRMPTRATTVVDVETVRQFLAGLPHNWQTYPRRLRNRLLKLLIERVELRPGRGHIEATIIWRVGFRQRIMIQRPPARGSRDKRWGQEEIRILKMLWPSSSREVLEAALPSRRWKPISCYAQRLGLKRQRSVARGWNCRPWSQEDENRAKAVYESGVAMPEMVAQLGRSAGAIVNRAAKRGWSRPASAKWKRAEATWQCDSLKLSYQASCGSDRLASAPGPLPTTSSAGCPRCSLPPPCPRLPAEAWRPPLYRPPLPPGARQTVPCGQPQHSERR